MSLLSETPYWPGVSVLGGEVRAILEVPKIAPKTVRFGAKPMGFMPP